MSLIHKALQLGEREVNDTARVASVTPEVIQKERELTSPSSKWMEMYENPEYSESGKEAVASPKKSSSKKNSRSQFEANRHLGTALIVVAILMLAGGFTAFNFFQVQPANHNSVVAMAQPVASAPVAEPEMSVPLPPTGGVSLAQNLTLSGIIDGNERMALINNRAVGKGDYIGNARVKEIQGRRVILETDGREVFLVL